MRIPEGMDEVDLDSDKSSKLVLMDIQEVIRYERCCVIFGKPGIGKTTLARWIILENTRTFSRMSNEDSSIEINEVRLPIFVRLDEIAQILELHPNWTLLDCLCHLTWFEKGIIINGEDQKNFARDYICQQHSMIILDGLDEIIDTSSQNRIIDLIYQFIQTYVLNTHTTFYQTATNISSNDNKLSKVSGNQLIITSRWFANVKNSQIEKIPCYSLRSLSFDDATRFIERWFQEIAIQLPTQSNMISLTTGEINVDNWHRKAKELIKNFTIQADLQQLTSNSTLLAAICGLVTVQTLVNPFSPISKRVVFYHFTSTLMLHRSWKNLKSSAILTEKEIECLLIDIAAYIHQHSSFGFIEEFDMRLQCRSSLKIAFEEKENTRWNRKIANDFVFRVSTNNIGLIVPCGPDLYNFLLPAFQHYFTCLSLVRTPTMNCDDQKSLIESVVNRVLYHITDSLYREPLLLTLSYISWQWTSSEIDLFYEQLLSVDAVRFNRQLPLAAMLLMTALLELHALPSMKQWRI